MELKEAIYMVISACSDSFEATKQPSHDHMLECATRIFNNNRGNGMPTPIKVVPMAHSDTEPASQAQMKLMVKLGIEFGKDITMREASGRIQAILGKKE